MKIKLSILNSANPFMLSLMEIGSLPWGSKERVALKHLIVALKKEQEVYHEIIYDERKRLGIGYSANGELVTGENRYPEFDAFIRAHGKTEVEIGDVGPLILKIPPGENGKEVLKRVTATLEANVSEIIEIEPAV